MIFHIQPDSPVPIYEQIVAQVTFAVAAGSLRPGDFIPSVRDLANDLVINPNTVAKAFVELEEQGVVEARRGRGMVIADEARRPVPAGAAADRARAHPRRPARGRPQRPAGRRDQASCR